MLSVAVHKDVAEYQPKIIGKLTARTLICIAGALLLSLASGCYIYFVLGLSVTDNIWIVYAVSLPFWLCGFYRPKGMKFEEFLPAWIRHQLSDNRLPYLPTMMKLGYVSKNDERRGTKYDKQYRKFTRTKGIEAYSPRAGLLSSSGGVNGQNFGQCK